jgi:two-component sensor histidine kinase
MEFITPLRPEPAATLALALIASSKVPLLLLDDRFTIVSASASFCSAFAIDPDTIAGLGLAAIGNGEWNVPQLHSLLRATMASNAAVDAYEMDLVRDGRESACVVVNAQRLELGGDQHPMIALTVTDITSARLAQKLKDALVQEKQVLLQELQHRVANSLQIIASVLMQSARRVQSDETRTHLYSAHNRVMSIATLQKQLAVASDNEVELRAYLKDLCASIGASMIDDAGGVSLTSTADDSKATANVSVSLGLIVTELVINALKHAFPGEDQSGSVTVDYAAKGSGWTLNVEDDGVGIAAGDGQGTPGLGTGIVDALAKQLGATVTTTDSKPGTKVSVVHP